jgi:SagB-type dehydrogenase family enzyme
VTYRRAPTLVTYWDGRRLVVENYLTRTRTAATPLAIAALDALSSWSGPSRLTAVIPGLSTARARRLIAALKRATLVERHPGSGGRLPRDWGAWLPHAGLLHFGARDERYPTPARAAAAVAGIPNRRIPPATRSYRGRATVPLPAPAALAARLDDALGQRRTWRRFGTTPLALADLATLLHTTWGVQRWATAERGRRVALKTSPSGGAMHPGEVYVAAFRVAGLPNALYHYDAARHRLARLGPLRRGGTGRYLPQQPWYTGASAILLMTAAVGRERWKYRSPRAYRAMLIDAGHLGQTFCLGATALGLAPFCSMALADSTVEGDLGLDGSSEVALYATGVGTRPSGRVTSGSTRRRGSRRG